MTAKEITDTHLALQFYPGYADEDIRIFQEFVNPHARAEAGFVVDFVGSRIRTDSLWKEARELDGELVGIPVPADFHAEAIEWLGLLKAVRSAKNQYVAMELGAGFGPWVVAGAQAARLRGISDIRLCAVEADSHHFRSLRQHFVDNDLEPDRHTLIEAAVGAQAGVAEWPVFDTSSARENWGERPVETSGDYKGRDFSELKRVEIVSLSDLLGRELCWDLIHLDVQGHEVDICRSCIDALRTKVRWMVIATHSRKLEGDLLELMNGAGWFLEHEKPSRFTFSASQLALETMTTLDGTQVWRNPAFLQAGDPLTSFDQQIMSSINKVRVGVGEPCVLQIEIRNSGTQPWYRNDGGPGAVNLGYRWLNSDTAVLPLEGDRSFLPTAAIEPGGRCTLDLKVIAPSIAGNYTLLVSMVQEGVAWFFTRGSKPFAVEVSVI